MLESVDNKDGGDFDISWLPLIQKGRLSASLYIPPYFLPFVSFVTAIAGGWRNTAGWWLITMIGIKNITINLDFMFSIYISI